MVVASIDLENGLSRYVMADAGAWKSGSPYESNPVHLCR